MTSPLEPLVETRLDQGLDELGLLVTDAQRSRLLGLLGLLHKWNRAYNLTAVRTPQEMVTKHLLDSAAVLPFVAGKPLLDVGAGPGLPGLVLAILRPGLAVTLLDSNGKKVRFQRQAVMELGLDNVTPVQCRVEEFSGQFDQVISRAFASLGVFVKFTAPLIAPAGQWLAMKGPALEEELRALPPGIESVAQHELRVPFEPARRRLVILARTQSRP
jgi:16S rRNA (guanine527-N7)-methyltransferase